MKLLTIAIPAYNTERYLSRCLDSLTYDLTTLDQIDIIVVNDGSTDQTAQVAKTYAKRFPQAVSVIDKANGGHGSTINTALKAAKGKYFRAIDSDDWVNIDDFSDYIQALAKLDVDFLVTNYQERHLYDLTNIPRTFQQPDQKVLSTADLEQTLADADFFFKFSMHSLTVKTNILKKVWDDGLLEKTFYVDQQYVAKVLKSAKTYSLLNYDIYRYFIGRPEQSVGMAGFYKHRQDHERVLRWLLSEQANLPVTQQYLQPVLRKQIVLMLNTHYEIYYQKFDADNQVINELLAFDQFLQTNFPEIHQQLPAAKNLAKRLAPWRRKMKAKLYKSGGVK